MIILYTSLVFACVSFGVMVSRKLQRKLEFYENLRDFLSAYASNLSFLQKEFKEVVDDYTQLREDRDFSRYIISFIKGEEDPPDFLTEKEIVEVRGLLKSLGTQDADTEERMISSAISLVKTKIGKASKRVENYSSLSIKLSLLVGVLLVILLI